MHFKFSGASGTSCANYKRVKCMSGLVTKWAYLAETGMTDGQFRGKVQRKQFIRNKHYFVVDRITWVDVEAVEEWIKRRGQRA